MCRHGEITSIPVPHPLAPQKEAPQVGWGLCQTSAPTTGETRPVCLLQGTASALPKPFKNSAPTTASVPKMVPLARIRSFHLDSNVVTVKRANGGRQTEILAHEIGHMLGLEHTDHRYRTHSNDYCKGTKGENSQSIMYSVPQAEATFAACSVRELKGVIGCVLKPLPQQPGTPRAPPRTRKSAMAPWDATRLTLARLCPILGHQCAMLGRHASLRHQHFVCRDVQPELLQVVCEGSHQRAKEAAGKPSPSKQEPKQEPKQEANLEAKPEPR